MKPAHLFLVVSLFIAGCSRQPFIPPWNGKLSAQIPEPLRTALEQAPEFDLYSLDPKHRDEDAPSSFYRRQVLGKIRITDAKTRERILGALDFGVRSEHGVPPACFDPRHAIRVEHDGKTFYLPICFECGHVYVFVDDQEKPLYFRIEGTPLPVFNEVLRTANIQLAEPASLQDDLKKRSDSPANSRAADELQKAFRKMIHADASRYSQARERLLALPEVELFLQRASNDDSLSVEDRWLSEILLWRKTSPDEVARLEKIFHEKSAHFRSSYAIVEHRKEPLGVIVEKQNLPLRLVLGNSRQLGRLVENLETDRDGIFDHGSERTRIMPSVEAILAGKVDGDISKAVKEYFEDALLPPSDHWGFIAGETVLKGWTRTPDLPKDQQYKEEPDPSQPVGFGPHLQIAALSHSIYCQNAMHVLGELHETRARHLIEEILQGRANDKWKRESAAEVLAMLRCTESIEALEKLVITTGADDDDKWVSGTAIQAIAAIGGTPAIESLRRIAAEKGDENDSSDRIAQRAEALLREIELRPDRTVPLEKYR